MIFFTACFYCSAIAQNIEVGSRVDKTSIPIGDQTVLRISAHMPVKTDITFPLLADSLGKIQIVKSLKADTVIDKNDRSNETVTHNYLITSFDTGIYLIPEMEFHTKAGILRTGTVTIQVKSVPVDTTKAFYDIKQPFAVSYNLWDWLKDHWIWVVSILAIILLVAGIIYYVKNHPKGISIVKAGPVLSADATALKKLYELRDKKLLQQNEVKLYYSELTEILREYLEARYHIKTHEQTSGEILAALQRTDLAVAARNRLKQLLNLADLVKFAKENPLQAVNEQSMEDAIEFVNQTRKDLQLPVHGEELPK
jgi:hypothetical protein